LHAPQIIGASIYNFKIFDNLQDEKNNKETFMPEFLWDVNESHRKSIGE
jgi:hypothetical protein